MKGEGGLGGLGYAELLPVIVKNIYSIGIDISLIVS